MNYFWKSKLIVLWMQSDRKCIWRKCKAI